MCFEIITMKQKLFTILFVCAALALQTESYSQGFLKKLKDKVEKKAEEVLDKKVTDKTGTTNVPANNNTNTNLPGTTKNGRPINKSGEGLKNSTVPDVVQQITDADLAFNKQQFGEVVSSSNVSAAIGQK